ncbi:MAG: tyrosine-type recombinase/integrase [Candidatus Sulfotelmatobacter sp.]
MGIRSEINKNSADAGTFGVLALRYLDAETHDDAAVHYVKKVMIPAWGNVIADDIKRKDVREWLKTLDYSGPTIGKIKGIMHAVYEYGLFEEFCSSNPCSDWHLKGVKSTYKAIIVTPQQTLTKSMTDLLHFTLVLTVAATALRASEVMSLRWSDIMWKENRIRVNKRWRKGRDGKPKTAASDSTVALGSILAYHLRVWRKASAYTSDSDFVFPSRTKNGSVPICASVFDRSHLRKAAIAAGVRTPEGHRFGLHNLRHSLSNWLVNQGKVDLKTVQEMLRHSKVQTTLDLYTQGDNDNKISAQDRFCGLIVDQPASAVNA